MLAKQRSKVFGILAMGCALHLLLDALQVKWANGVHFLAPVSWDLLRFNLFWPDSLGTYVLMAAGFIYFVFNLSRSVQPNNHEFSLNRRSLSLSGALFLTWLVMPIAFIQSVYLADNHYVNTLKQSENRVGKYIEIDRNLVSLNGDVANVKTSYGETIRLEGGPQFKDGVVISLQGKFTDNSTIRIGTYHLHSGFRDIASILGLLCVLLVWTTFLARSWAKIGQQKPRKDCFYFSGAEEPIYPAYSPLGCEFGS